MSSLTIPRFVTADRFQDSVIIIFNDGRGGVYSSELLYAQLPHSELIEEPEDEPEE